VPIFQVEFNKKAIPFQEWLSYKKHFSRKYYLNNWLLSIVKNQLYSFISYDNINTH